VRRDPAREAPNDLEPAVAGLLHDIADAVTPTSTPIMTGGAPT
jgi:hypothetical protein